MAPQLIRGLALTLAMTPALATEEPPLDMPQPPTLTADGFEGAAAVPDEEPFQLLGTEIQPGQRQQLNWEIEAAMGAVALPTPVLVAHGTTHGPVLCLTAAIHGDELTGVEVVRRILFDLKPEDLTGTVIGIPIVNASGYLRSSRYLPDRRDLNRFFPGSTTGSLASRFARALFDTIISRCTAVVDLHTGSFQRKNLPQLRADLTNPEVEKFSRQFGNIAVLHSAGPRGSLRRAATDVGIAAVTLEAGEASRFDKDSVDKSVEALQSLLSNLNMVSRFRFFGEPQPAFYESTWVRANSGGILFTEVTLGETVKKGQVLGTVTDPIRNDMTNLVAPFNGRILGMAVNQVVMPGFAAYHVGRQASVAGAIADAVEYVGPPAPEDGLPADVDSPPLEEVEVLGDPMAPPQEPANDAAATETVQEPVDNPQAGETRDEASMVPSPVSEQTPTVQESAPAVPTATPPADEPPAPQPPAKDISRPLSGSGAPLQENTDRVLNPEDEAQIPANDEPDGP
ncbi:MAG: succinylglutamate desuccinylase/aspartoacylase family protein [Pseudomonadota bacterium]